MERETERENEAAKEERREQGLCVRSCIISERERVLDREVLDYSNIGKHLCLTLR